MGFICLPFSLFLFWLMLRPKKEAPFPKRGLLRLLIAGAVSVVLSIVLNLPVEAILSFFRFGFFSDPAALLSAFQGGSDSIAGMLQNAQNNTEQTFLWTLIDMFFAAGLLEEGLKFLTCRAAIRKEGMIRTWMDCVICFAIVGITFEFIENIAFGMDSDFLSALVRSVGCAHFIFGVIMGWFYGKYRVTGQKKYCLLSLVVPVLYHTFTNSFMASIDTTQILTVLGEASGISHIVVTVLTVIIVIRWQKSGKLNVPVLQKAPKQ